MKRKDIIVPKYSPAAVSEINLRCRMRNTKPFDISKKLDILASSEEEAHTTIDGHLPTSWLVPLLLLICNQ